jgi:aryl-alcohol dehydrogenase-like predicted oxidoreductase
MREIADLGAKDARRKVPRFHPENFEHNIRLLNQLQKIADAKNCTLAQLSLAWILHQGESFVPIPGTYQISHLEENTRAAEIDLTTEELAEIDRLFPRTGAAAGARHDKDRSHELNI